MQIHCRQVWGWVRCVPAWTQGDVIPELRLHPSILLYCMQSLLFQVCCLHGTNMSEFCWPTQLMCVFNIRDMGSTT